MYPAYFYDLLLRPTNAQYINFKLLDTQQVKIYYFYKNMKLKLIKTKTAIWYKKYAELSKGVHYDTDIVVNIMCFCWSKQ